VGVQYTQEAGQAALRRCIALPGSIGTGHDDKRACLDECPHQRFEVVLNLGGRERVNTTELFAQSV